MEKQTFKKWWKRLTSPTGEDFKWLRSRAIALGTTAMAIIGLAQVGVILPPVLVTICSYVVILTVGISGTASFTREPLVKEYVGDKEEKPVVGQGEEQKTEV